MTRSQFDELTADDARVKATEETDADRKEAWWELAAAIDTSRGKTVGRLPEEIGDRLFAATGAASATITAELLARTAGESEQVRDRETGEEGGPGDPSPAS